MNTNLTPFYKSIDNESCNICNFLGTAIIWGINIDFYLCEDRLNGPAIIARDSEEVWGYQEVNVDTARSCLTSDPVWGYALTLLDNRGAN